MDTDVPAENPTDRSESHRTADEVVRSSSNRPSDVAERRTTERCDDDDDSGERAVADRREVERLEAELARKEEQLRYVTEQYERLLAEKDRKLAAESDADAASERRPSLRSRLVRFLSSLR